MDLLSFVTYGKIISAILDRIDIIINHERDGDKFLETMCLVQLISAIDKMVRSESEEEKRKVTPFSKHFCFEPEPKSDSVPESKKSK